MFLESYYGVIIHTIQMVFIIKLKHTTYKKIVGRGVVNLLLYFEVINL